jgi:hypothetical protein
MSKALVYIAGPISRPDPIMNTRAAVLLYRRMIVDDVVTPFCPHLSILVPLVAGGGGDSGAVDGHDFWLPHDFEVINNCHALFRMPGESFGADQEVVYAAEIGIPVFTIIDDLYEWAAKVELR